MQKQRAILWRIIQSYLTNNNMYYYTFNNDVEQVCNALNSYGFNKDRWSCEDKDAKGIGLVSYSAGDNCSIMKIKKYVLLSECMMSKGPSIGWVEPYRKEVKNVQEFLDICSNLA